MYILGRSFYFNPVFLLFLKRHFLSLQEYYLLYVADFRLFFNVAAHELAVDKPKRLFPFVSHSYFLFSVRQRFIDELPKLRKVCFRECLVRHISPDLKRIGRLFSVDAEVRVFEYCKFHSSISFKR